MNIVYNKITSFDSLRFLLCLVIIFHHIGINIYNFSNKYFRIADLAVEGFFLLSGFLLAKSIEKTLLLKSQENIAIKEFFIKRVKRLYPEYIIAMFLCFVLVNLFAYHISAKTFLLNCFLLAGWGGIPNIIDGIWYVVILFWGGMFIYIITIFYKNKATVLFLPILSVICLFYLINHGNNIGGHQYPIEFSLISKGTIRGFLGLSIGLFCYHICNNLQNLTIKFNEKYISIILMILEFISIIQVIRYLSFEKNHSIADFNFYFYMSYIICLLYCRKEKLLKFLSFNIWKNFSYLSYSIYLTHLIVISILKKQFLIFTQLPECYTYVIIAFICLFFAFFSYLLQKFIFSILKAKLLK